MTNLDDLKTFIEAVHTTQTPVVKHAGSSREINNVEDVGSGTSQVYINEGEFIKSSNYEYTERYEIELMEKLESGISTAMKEIQEGIRKLGFWETITDYTKPSNFHGIEFISGSRTFQNPDKNRWLKIIKIDVRWGTT